jgi:hypothetical protein
MQVSPHTAQAFTNAPRRTRGPQGEGIPPHCNVHTAPVQSASLEKIAASLKEAYPSQFMEWKLTDDGFVNIDGKKSYYLSCQYVEQTEDEKLRVQSIQYVVLGTKKTFILTFATIPKDFGHWKNTFEDAALSVQTD